MATRPLTEARGSGTGLRSGPAARWRVGCGIALLILSVAKPAGAQPAANFQFGFPLLGGVPGTPPPSEAALDGVVINDVSWDGAFRHVFQNGTPDVDGVVQGGRDGSSLYLSFEVKNETTFDEDDMIILCFDPDGAAGNLRRFHIYPNNNGVAAALNSPPRSVEYWKGSHGAWGAVTLNPPWLRVRVNGQGAESVPAATPVSWSLEMRVPITANAADPNGVNIPAMGPFKMYVNVIKTNRFGTINHSQNRWPPTPTVVEGNPENTTPPVNLWGNGTRSGTVNGVHFGAVDITTNQNPVHQISLTAANVFTVTMHNSSVTEAGAPVAANNITARFRIANFGLSNAWADVPATSGGTNPTAPLASIGPGSTGTRSVTWTLSAAERTTYDTPATRHQCILVELNSTTPGTTFVNRSAWRNMNFETVGGGGGDGGGKIKLIAAIDARGFGPPPPGRNDQEFEVRMRKVDRSALLAAVRAADGPGTADGPRATDAFRAAAAANAAVIVTRGTRRTGKQLQVKGRTYEVWEDAGAFGYVLQPARGTDATAGAQLAASLRPSLSAKGLTGGARPDGSYRVSVPVNGVMELVTEVDPAGGPDPNVPTTTTAPTQSGTPGGLPGRVEDTGRSKWWLWVLLGVVLLVVVFMAMRKKNPNP